MKEIKTGGNRDPIYIFLFIFILFENGWLNVTPAIGKTIGRDESNQMCYTINTHVYLLFI